MRSFFVIGLLAISTLVLASFTPPSSSLVEPSSDSGETEPLPKVCSGCDQRGGSYTKTLGAGSCTTSLRERYVSYKERCTKNLASACPDRTCEFRWQLQAKLSGPSSACNGNSVTVQETIPPSSPLTTPLTTTSWSSIIPEVSIDGAECGYQTLRTGSLSATTGGQVPSYSFTIGCESCGNP